MKCGIKNTVNECLIEFPQENSFHSTIAFDGEKIPTEDVKHYQRLYMSSVRC